MLRQGVGLSLIVVNLAAPLPISHGSLPRSTLRWYVAKQREMDFKLPAKWRAIVPYLY